MRAAVWDGATLEVRDDVVVRPPAAGEVAVDLVASGICHSDLNVIEHGSPPPPVILGHEGAGVVSEVGPGVTDLRVGDPVVVCTMTPCRTCRHCARGRYSACATVFRGGPSPFSHDGRSVRAYANLSSFASRVTVRASQCVPAPGLSARGACLISCAVSTGYGVVRNVAEVGPGDTVVVIGVGGIGVNALQTARLQGAAQVIAVDVNPAKEPAARRFGADGFVVVEPGAGAADVAATVRHHAGIDIDAVIECSGVAPAMAAALAMVGPTGTVALVGIPPPGTRLDFDAVELVRGRRVLGSLNGNIDPARDIADIVALAQDGRLELDAQVSAVFPLARVVDAVAAVGRGENVRVVLDHTSS